MSTTFKHIPGDPGCICDPCCEASARRIQIEQEAREAYQHVSNFLNGRNAADLVQAIKRDHRTLQQAFTGVCIAWFNYLASCDENHYDLRNAASVDLARAITRTKEWEEKAALPYI